MGSKAEILPYFPLTVFLFPGEDIPLRIFEPRYKELMEDIRKTGETFVIPFVIGQDIQDLGCEVRLQNVVAENPGGRMVVLSYSKRLDGKLYAGGVIKRLPCSDPVESDELKSLIQNYIKDFDQDLPGLNGREDFTRQDVMKALNLPSDDKYRFMSLPDGRQKEGYLAGQLRYLRMIRKQESLLGDDFGLN
jgi:hypothetical protein